MHVAAAAAARHVIRGRCNEVGWKVARDVKMLRVWENAWQVVSVCEMCKMSCV